MLKSCLYHNLIEAGCDEAGRGCLAGPVVAAAVILPKNYRHPVLNDSKKLSAKLRSQLKDEIINSAVSWNVAFIDNNEIDSMNILRASIKAMHVAIEGLDKEPQSTVTGSTHIKTQLIKRSLKATVFFFQLQQLQYWQKHFVMNTWKRSIMNSLNTIG
jgi:ribonuclease HII